MYGTRLAANSWQAAFTSTLTEAGFKHGRSNPCLFVHEGKNLSTFVYGDGFVSSGPLESLKWLERTLHTTHKIPSTLIGGRIIGNEGVSIESRH